jgi:hypothetical protein
LSWTLDILTDSAESLAGLLKRGFGHEYNCHIQIADASVQINCGCCPSSSGVSSRKQATEKIEDVAESRISAHLRHEYLARWYDDLNSWEDMVDVVAGMNFLQHALYGWGLERPRQLDEGSMAAVRLRLRFYCVFGRLEGFCEVLLQAVPKIRSIECKVANFCEHGRPFFGQGKQTPYGLGNLLPN